MNRGVIGGNSKQRPILGDTIFGETFLEFRSTHEEFNFITRRSPRDDAMLHTTAFCGSLLALRTSKKTLIMGRTSYMNIHERIKHVLCPRTCMRAKRRDSYRTEEKQKQVWSAALTSMRRKFGAQFQKSPLNMNRFLRYGGGLWDVVNGAYLPVDLVCAARREKCLGKFLWCSTKSFQCESVQMQARNCWI